MISTALVHIWGKLAGAVAWDDQHGVGTFEYDPSFVRTGWELSPLKMPLSAPSRTFTFPELRNVQGGPLDTFKGLPGLLADVLPDRYGHQLINAWLAGQGGAPDSLNPIELLCFIGKRGVGALEFEPSHFAENRNTFTVEVDDLVEVAQKMLSNKDGFATNLQSDGNKAIQDILKIGTSAGGARPKAVIAFNEKTGEVRSGQTRAPKGFEHWILKLDGVSDVQLGQTSGYGRVEMAYYNMAVDCGIDIMPSRLLEENGRAHFMTRRFDRDEGDVKHHIQSFCALKHFDYNEVTSFSYEQLFQCMRELRLGYPEAEQQFRRMVFNVMSRNCDDHTKNFAFRLKRDGRWTIAPAFDLCHAYRPDSQWVSQHALSINGKRKNISRNDLLQVAKAMNIRKPKSILDEVVATIRNWRDFADQVGVEPKLRDAIHKTLIVL